MINYLDAPTVKTRLSAYKQTEDFERDVACLRNEYELRGRAVPSENALRKEVLREKENWLERLSRCESKGHRWSETADGKSSSGILECSRCGMTHYCK